MNKVTTKEKIIEAASKLFWEKSYQSVSVDVICQESGIKKGSFYHFYESKEEVALAVLEFLWKNTKERDLKPVIDSSDFSPLDKIYRILDLCEANSCEMHDDSGKFKGCPFGNLALELGTQKDKVRKHVATIFDEYYHFFFDLFLKAKEQGELKEDIDPHHATRIFLSCLEGSCVLAKTYNDAQLIGSNLRQFLAMISL